MCIRRLGILAGGHGALTVTCPSPAGHGAEQFRHEAYPLSESPIRNDCKKSVYHYPEAQEPAQNKVHHLSEGHTLPDIDDILWQEWLVRAL